MRRARHVERAAGAATRREVPFDLLAQPRGVGGEVDAALIEFDQPPDQRGRAAQIVRRRGVRFQGGRRRGGCGGHGPARGLENPARQ